MCRLTAIRRAAGRVDAERQPPPADRLHPPLGVPREQPLATVLPTKNKKKRVREAISELCKRQVGQKILALKKSRTKFQNTFFFFSYLVN